MALAVPAARLCALLLLAGSTPLLAAQRPNFDEADRLAREAVEQGRVPSIAFAIARNGTILHEAAFGLADRETGRVATVHTAYPLASATKPITATAVMIQHERRQLDLSSTVAATLPDVRLPDAAAGITLTQLLTHTSGLGTYAKIHYGEAIATAPSLAAELQHYGTPVSPTGRVAEYSNLGYGLLGEVVARVEGKPFAAAARDLVFAPLGMDDAFIDTPRKGQRDIAVAYGSASERLPPLRNNTPGAGNAHASAHDLIRFSMLHAGDGHTKRSKLLSRSGIAHMQQRNDDALHHYYGDAFYGLGWYVRTDHGVRTVWHEGGMPGASTIIKLLPDEGLSVVVLANRSDANEQTQALADALLRAAWPAYAPAPLNPVAGYALFAGQSGFTGSWHGTLRVDDALLDCVMTVTRQPPLHLRCATADRVMVDADLQAMVNGDSFISAVPGTLPSADIATKDPPLLLLKLVRNGESMSGAVVAYSSPERLDYLLPFAIILQRRPVD